MAEQTPNTECRICGKKYYSCKTCNEIGHWKAVACSPEHYAEYVERVLDERNKEENIETIDNTVKEEVVVEATEDVITDKVVSKKNNRKKISEKTI